MKEIEIIIDLEGNPHVEAKGFQGKGCKDATKVFEDALGTVTEYKKKSEFMGVERVSNLGKLNRS